ncbi:MAG: hypothetical protein COA86_18160 [Kangiella sp.]|nr:MAG: hypothetical protein COA86_18160 [Kangiella sp.]
MKNNRLKLISMLLVGTTLSNYSFSNNVNCDIAAKNTIVILKKWVEETGSEEQKIVAKEIMNSQLTKSVNKCKEAINTDAGNAYWVCNEKAKSYAELKSCLK